MLPEEVEVKELNEILQNKINNYGIFLSFSCQLYGVSGFGIELLFWTSFLKLTDNFACVPVSEDIFPYYVVNRGDFLFAVEKK